MDTLEFIPIYSDPSLRHGLPRGRDSQTKIVEGTPDFHHHVTYLSFVHPTGVLQHPTAFNATIDMFNPHPTARQRPIRGFLFLRQLLPTRFADRGVRVHVGQGKRQKAEVLE